MIRVLIADDHAVVRRGLRQILEAEHDLVAAAEASTAREVLRALRLQDFDVLLLDIAMPDGGGLEVLRQLKGLRPELPVLMLSVYGERQYAPRLLQAGAAGYLTKESAPDELVTALRRVARGGTYITPTVAAILIERLERGETRPREALSDREFQVMCLLASGKTISGIAEDLSLSVKTVSTYRTRILEKLQLESTADIIRHAIRHDLVE
ncbi:MAG: response regulator [Chloroflexota bacterium]